MNVPLAEYATGTLDGSGNGTLRLGPTAHGQVWRPQVASVRMTGAAPAAQATCYVYAGDAATDPNFVDATYDVNNDSTDRVTGTELRLGQYVFARWTGGNAGATATLSITGTKDI